MFGPDGLVMWEEGQKDPMIISSFRGESYISFLQTGKRKADDILRLSNCCLSIWFNHQYWLEKAIQNWWLLDNYPLWENSGWTSWTIKYLRSVGQKLKIAATDNIKKSNCSATSACKALTRRLTETHHKHSLYGSIQNETIKEWSFNPSITAV